MSRCTYIVIFILIINFKQHICLDIKTQNVPKSYAGYSVFRAVPVDETDLENLKSLAEKEEYELDFWKHPKEVNQAVDIMVPPDKIQFIEQFLVANRIPRTIMMFDVERYIIKEKIEMSTPSFLIGRDSNAFFTNYKGLTEIFKFMEDTAAMNPNIAETMSIGVSTEGNDLKVIKIGSKSNNSTKPAIWINGGIHAREWISPATVSFIAHSLVMEYDNHDEVKEIVDYFDWYLLPVSNPDGYVYSHTFNRMWRKSRTRAQIFCRGVDLNRNFGFHWKEGGSSARPCSDTFAGSRAFSEPETKAISDFIMKQNKRFVAFLDIHSYSQLWLTPWGWTNQLPKDYDDMIEVANEATKALYDIYGTKYRTGSSTNVLYVATGGSDDWAYGTAGIKYSYTVELRDTGRYGFMLPSEQIIPTGEETWAGIKAMAKAIQKKL